MLLTPKLLSPKQIGTELELQECRPLAGSAKTVLADIGGLTTPAPLQGTPILAVDVCEHACYLRYQNKRGDYLAAWWTVVNWNEVNRLFEAASGQ